MTLKLRLAAIGITVAGLAAGIGAFAAGHNPHQYPPPFPRQGAVKVLENSRVVVWDVTWPKGVRGPVHEHYRDAVIVTLTGGTIEKFPLDGKSTTAIYKSDSVIFAPKGVIHSEEGISDVPRHAFVIELK